jgi:Family of unknown function (DUF5683)
MKPVYLLLFFSCCYTALFAQSKSDSSGISAGIRVTGLDSVAIRKAPVDTAGKRKHSPRKATIRSAILPGWGQAYNKKYWKIPIVYAALGITAGVFNYNIKEYRKIQYAYGVLVTRDTANYKNVSKELQPYLELNAESSLRNIRSEFRQNIDYSVLIFILMWGLNVVDATVDGHLKEFDVSDNLSLKIKPSLQSLPNTAGISFVFTIGKHSTARPLKAIY